METIGNQKIWSFVDGEQEAKAVSNTSIRGGRGHEVQTYFELARKVADLQFRNREHVLLFRGQDNDYLTTKGNSMLKSSMFRLNGTKRPGASEMAARFALLARAETELVARYEKKKWLGRDRLKRHRIIRWAILQHYEICRTPLLDVTQSLRIAVSFASLTQQSNEVFVFVLGVPEVSGAVTASSEANLQIVRLSSACPPIAVRPHLQEGYLLGEYPEISDDRQNSIYQYYEMDFGRRLVAKFRFNPKTIGKSENFPLVPKNGLYMSHERDEFLSVANDISTAIESTQ